MGHRLAPAGTVRDPSAIRAWLASVTANEARRLAKRQRRRVVRETALRPLADTDPSAEIDQIDLANALAQLRPDDRSLLALRYVAGLDSSEIARLRGGSASGVRSRLSRLLERLRRELDQ